MLTSLLWLLCQLELPLVLYFPANLKLGRNPVLPPYPICPRDLYPRRMSALYGRQLKRQVRVGRTEEIGLIPLINDSVRGAST